MNIRIDYPPPSHWQDLEELVKMITSLIWVNGSPTIYGRQGQYQGGIDIICHDDKWRLTGIQCKKRKQLSEEGQLITSKTLSIDLVIKELRSAEKHLIDEKLERFILGTTAVRDAKIQKKVVNLNQTQLKEGKCLVDIWFWEDFLEYLNKFPVIGYWYYEDFLKERDFYKMDGHILHFLKDAFDRPAFQTPFHLENSSTGFLQAIIDTQEAIKTGVLRSREDRSIYQSALPANRLSNPTWNTAFKLIAKDLHEIRLLYTKATREKIIKEHPSVIEILDRNVAEGFNTKRANILKKLNQILLEANIDTLESELLDN